MHPGGIAGTSLNRMTSPDQLDAVMSRPEVARRMKNAEQGAATTVWAAIAKEWERERR